MALTPKQARFVAEYLVDLNATQAAVRAGYSRKTAEQQGSRLLRNAQVQTAVQAGQKQHLEDAGLTASKWREEIRRVAFSDVGDVFNEQDALQAIRKLPKEVRSAIASVKVVKKNLTTGDNAVEYVHEVKLWDKLKALDLAGKHLGMLTENASVSGTIQLVWGESPE